MVDLEGDVLGSRWRLSRWGGEGNTRQTHMRLKSCQFIRRQQYNEGYVCLVGSYDLECPPCNPHETA